MGKRVSGIFILFKLLSLFPLADLNAPISSQVMGQGPI